MATRTTAPRAEDPGRVIFEDRERGGEKKWLCVCVRERGRCCLACGGSAAPRPPRGCSSSRCKLATRRAPARPASLSRVPSHARGPDDLSGTLSAAWPRRMGPVVQLTRNVHSSRGDLCLASFTGVGRLVLVCGSTRGGAPSTGMFWLAPPGRACMQACSQPTWQGVRASSSMNDVSRAVLSSRGLWLAHCRVVN